MWKRKQLNSKITPIFVELDLIWKVHWKQPLTVDISDDARRAHFESLKGKLFKMQNDILDTVTFKQNNGLKIFQTKMIQVIQCRIDIVDSVYTEDGINLNKGKIGDLQKLSSKCDTYLFEAVKGAFLGGYDTNEIRKLNIGNHR